MRLRSVSEQVAGCLVPVLLLVASSVPALADAEKAKGDLLGLKRQYEAAVDRQVEPLRIKYLAELKRQMEAYTKAGNLDAALVFRAELKAEGGKWGVSKQALPENAEELKAYLVSGVWAVLGDVKSKYQFNESGDITITSTGVRPTYKVTGRRTFEMIWNQGAPGILCWMSEDGLAFKETDGNKTVWTRSSP